jgi:hypothetical protein
VAAENGRRRPARLAELRWTVPLASTICAKVSGAPSVSNACAGTSPWLAAAAAASSVARWRTSRWTSPSEL